MAVHDLIDVPHRRQAVYGGAGTPVLLPNGKSARRSQHSTDHAIGHRLFAWGCYDSTARPARDGNASVVTGPRRRSLVDEGLRILLAAAGVVALLWFLHQILIALLITFMIIVLAIVMNAPVTWLEDRRVPRAAGTLLMFAAVAAVVVLLGWLVLPRLVTQSHTLIDNLPTYVSNLRDRAADFLGDSAIGRTVQDQIPADTGEIGDLLPPAPEIVRIAGEYSMALVEGLALLVIVAATVGYIVARPRPMYELYLRSFPVRMRGPAERALTRAEDMCVGWMWSNIVAGAIEAVLVATVLGLLHVPAALVWAALAFFSELVPKVGAYIMGIPPFLVAFSVSPATALWVALFYIAMNEIVGNFVIPKVRAASMDMHASSVMFMMLFMGYAFGLPGALIATPITGFIKAFYEEFYLAERAPLDEDASPVERMLRRRLPEGRDTGQ